MAKTLKITYDDKEYTLKYTTATIQAMEKRGFDASLVENKPMTMLPLMFEGAFLANHPYVNPKKTAEIFDACEDKSGLIDALSDLLRDSFDAFMENKQTGKTATWSFN